MRAVEGKRWNHHLCSVGGVSGSVNGGSKRCDFQFVCVGKEMCTVLFSVKLFQDFALLV